MANEETTPNMMMNAREDDSENDSENDNVE
jgi:hypothetical protein